MPQPVPPTKTGRGRPPVYHDRLFLKALVIMIVRHRHTVGEFLAVLEPPPQERQRLRRLLTGNGAFPCRRTWERRLATLPDPLPERIACLGHFLLERLRVWQRGGRAVAVDSTPLRASGRPWHKKDKEAGKVPPTRIDTEAGWTKSGWHGGVYGWKLHIACTVGDVWLPLCAEMTPADEADNVVAQAGAFRVRRQRLQPPRPQAPMPTRRTDLGGLASYPEPVDQPPRGGGTACVSCVAFPDDRDLQQPIQEDLFSLGSGSHEGSGQHRAPGVGVGVGVPDGSVVSGDPQAAVAAGSQAVVTSGLRP